MRAVIADKIRVIKSSELWCSSATTETSKWGNSALNWTTVLSGLAKKKGRKKKLLETFEIPRNDSHCPFGEAFETTMHVADAKNTENTENEFSETEDETRSLTINN